ncbi:hypothetical protein E2C01_011733 [Portunus trituberculatus]|uniref:Uncharacterized protein n=1 Tax=Portunus trituberculatus TaxID=210409 RepID=A0A5B7DC92_PORTR|nr:hypothetical protein [Portunus trituberculatus]
MLVTPALCWLLLVNTAAAGSSRASKQRNLPSSPPPSKPLLWKVTGISTLKTVRVSKLVGTHSQDVLEGLNRAKLSRVRTEFCVP